jgi:hypothetical protein
MKRIIVALLVGGAVFGTVLGAAAGLDLNGGVIQGGTDDSLWCDADGVQVLGWGLNSGTGMVENVRVGGVNTDCAGAGLQARITLNDASTFITGPCSAGHDYEVPILDPEPGTGYRLCFKDVAAGGALVSVPAAAIVRLDVFIEGP